MPPPPPRDAVALDELGPGKKAGGFAARAGGRLAGAKVLISVFVAFVLVVSDVFTNNVLSGFRGATEGRTPTSFGVVLQGIFLVVFYALAVHLVGAGVI